MLVQSIMRSDLVKIASVSEVANTDEVKTFVKKLIFLGVYTEALEQEIEEYDAIYERLIQ